MKKVIFALTVFFTAISSSLYCGEAEDTSNPPQENTISIVCSPALYDLTSGWADEYTRLNPGMEIKVTALDQSLAEKGQAGEGLGFFSGNVAEGQAWKMTVGRDITVPVINAENPYLQELLKKGITAESISRLLSNTETGTWELIAGNNDKHAVNIYLSNEISVLNSLKKFTGLDDFNAKLVVTGSGEEVVKAVQNDPYAIGFCKLADAKAPGNSSLMAGIMLLPVDKNKNGKIDYMENIFDNPENFARGVWIGKYPRVLYSDIYCVSASQPEGIAEVAFLKWVLAAGQRLVSENGLSELVMSERQSRLADFNEINIIPPTGESNSLAMILVLSAAGLIIVSLITGRVIFLHKKRQLSGLGRHHAPAYFSKGTVNLPKGLYYDKTHTWAFMENDGMVRIGIDDFLQHVTGPITRIEMRKPGEKVRKGDMILIIIQNGKRLVVFAPLSGIIKENNNLLESRYSLINTSPYAEGWVYRIEPSNWLREIQLMEMAEKYQAWLSGEFARLKDFLSGSLKVNRMEYEAIVLQDGGMLKDGVLEDFGPEVWEDFQTNFLDSAI